MPIDLTHSVFNHPPENTKIWRYIDFVKFMSLLDSSSLYFSRLDQMSLEDPYEGLYPPASFTFYNRNFEDISEAERQSLGIDDKNIYEELKKSMVTHDEFARLQRDRTFINCWHINDHESAGMWKLYSFLEQGIAIQTTFKRLKTVLDLYHDHNIFLGLIKYIDYESEHISLGNILSPLVCKRKSYEHEKEIRAVIWTPLKGKNEMFGKNKFQNVNGIPVPIDLNTLIERIYLSPKSPPWLSSLISSIGKKYGLDVKVIQSNLNRYPNVV